MDFSDLILFSFTVSSQLDDEMPLTFALNWI